MIDGLEEWDEQYYGKKISVTGWPHIEYHKEKSIYPGEFQERVGRCSIIKKAKWKLVKEP